METVDILLIAGAVMIALFVGLLYVVLRAAARTAENAKEILLALEDITRKVKVMEELEGAAESVQLSHSQMSGTGTGTTSKVPANGSGDGTDVPS
ncbi:MAG TPA: hypothetical protein VNA57_01185 [Acidimicrobiales bacterium]|nr:hypothetical protein [Acidimicrobiales bacterium]